MPIYYDQGKKIFYLESKNVSYVMQISRFGFLTQLYYGAKIARDDISYVEQLRDRGSEAVIYGAPSRAYSPNLITSEYPSYGKGDFRECAFIPRGAERPLEDAGIQAFFPAPRKADAALFKDEHMIGSENAVRKVVRHEEHRLVLLLQLLQDRKEHALEGEVHIRRRLVEKDERGILHEQHGEKHFLLFPAREGGLLPNPTTSSAGRSGEGSICGKMLKSFAFSRAGSPLSSFPSSFTLPSKGSAPAMQ